ncbi:hypothetical protein E4T56_gene1562 [Termitomyces sp. T112]|nr:hypothetical protein E4T56_gene1562 [Termitomyces sp. T112]
MMSSASPFPLSPISCTFAGTIATPRNASLMATLAQKMLFPRPHQIQPLGLTNLTPALYSNSLGMAPTPHQLWISKYTLDKYSTSVMIQTYKVTIIDVVGGIIGLAPLSPRSLAPPPHKMHLRHPIMETATTAIIHGWTAQHKRRRVCAGASNRQCRRGSAEGIRNESLIIGESAVNTGTYSIHPEYEPLQPGLALHQHASSPFANPYRA